MFFIKTYNKLKSVGFIKRNTDIDFEDFLHKENMMYISNLDHFYDFIEQEHGIECVDMLKKFIAEHVSRETLQLQKNIELYSLGFN